MWICDGGTADEFFLASGMFISDHNLGLTVTKLGAMIFCQLDNLPTALLPRLNRCGALLA